MIIKSTTKYDTFSFLKQNREVPDRKVNSLIAAIKKNNFLPENPIVVDESFNIIAGQTRFKAAKALGLPIYYIPSPNMKVEHLAPMEAEHKAWNHYDYLHYYIVQGNKEYKILDQLIRRHGFSLTVGLCLLSAHPGASSIKAFKIGRFKVRKHLDEVEVLCVQIHDFGKWITWNKKKAFVVAILRLFSHNEYVHNVMLSKLEYLSTKLVKCPDIDSYLKMLEGIYNYKNSNKIHIRD